MRSTSFALLAAAIGLLGIVGGEQGARAGTSWHAQHSVPMSVAKALTDRLHGTSPRQSVISSLASCPDTISCSAGKGAVDRCCSPVMGLLVFVQQWYPKLGPKDAFTLHGLWPDNCDGSMGPSNGCDVERHYPDLGGIIRQADEQLYDQLNTYFSSYRGRNDLFWTHEWNKHGTCISTLEPQCLGDSHEKYQDVLTYFKTTLALRELYNPYTVLAKHDIVPGRRYKRELFYEALEQAWGQPVHIACRRGQISEVWLWMHVRGRDHYEPTAPAKPDTVGGRNACGNVIYYPPKSNAYDIDEDNSIDD